ncbi:MAG: hypothetical protein GX591_17860 [Planctomycetes bacterium]|nr:hypothetical protein [Planctomycetota bacterium]
MSRTNERTADRYREPGLVQAGRYEGIATRDLSNLHAGHEGRMNEHIARAEAAGARGPQGPTGA